MLYMVSADLYILILRTCLVCLMLLKRFHGKFCEIFSNNYMLMKLFAMIFEGDNFFKSASYTIEALCAETYLDTAVKLKDIEAQLLSKRNELSQFESEYREVFWCKCKWNSTYVI